MPKKTKDFDNTLENIKDILSPFKKSGKSTNDAKSVTSNKKPFSKNTTKNESNNTKTKSRNQRSNNLISNTKQKPTNLLGNEKPKSSKSISNNSKNTNLINNNKSKTTIQNKDKKNIVKNNKSKEDLSTKENKKTVFSPEYYDLPYRYNQTVVKILAQTPTNLFIYWEISDEDRNNFKKQYGEYFFEITKPVLVIHNKTLNYSFEIDINDFANSWYLKVNDSDCEYEVELGRRPIPINYSYMPQYDIQKDGPIKPVDNSYIYVSSSNILSAPNDHILFNKQDKIYFRNIKTNQVIEKEIKEFPFINKNNTSFVNIYEVYQNLYNQDISSNKFNFINPSSGNPSSGNFW